MQLPPTLLLFLAPLLASAQSSSRSASQSSHSQSESASASPIPSSSGLGTPSGTLSASLPSLSGVPICVTDCMAQATAADGCASFVAVDCFCPNPEPYMAALLACLANATLSSSSSNSSSHTLSLSSASHLSSSASASAPASSSSAPSCIDPLPDAASIVNQFCALAAVSTSLSFPASLPPLQSLTGSHSGSVTAPPQQSQSGSQTPNAAAAGGRGGWGVGGGWAGVGVVGAGMLAGAWAVL